MKFDIVDYNKKKYREEIEGFDCGVDTLNVLLKEISSHHCSAKIMMIDNVIAGYCAYRCYAVKVDDELYPAIEIRGFAMSKRFQGLKVKDSTLAAGFMRVLLKFFKEISEYFIRAKYVCLHSLDDPKVLKFYKKLNFERIDGAQVLEEEFNDKCIPHIISLSSIPALNN